MKSSIDRWLPDICSGLLGRTSLRPCFQPCSTRTRKLFRPSRPDFIETETNINRVGEVFSDCSGLLGRTSLRPHRLDDRKIDVWLFRPSRPDFIETIMNLKEKREYLACSGLLGRTSLRRPDRPGHRAGYISCSGLLGRTSLRLPSAKRRSLAPSFVPAF